MSAVDAKAVAPLRRSRRAASLTAQVLWNIQIEDDAKVEQQRSKSPTLDVCASAPPKTRKRNANDARQRNSESGNVAAKVGKKTRTSTDNKWTTNNNNAPFAKVKPFQASGKRTGQKLTASVAPLIKPATLNPGVGAVPKASVMTHTSPILLLPVALQPTPGPGHVTAGSLPLWTLPASPSLISCFGLNKSIEQNMNLSGHAWQTATVGTASALSTNTSRTCRDDRGFTTVVSPALNTARMSFSNLQSASFRSIRPALPSHGQDEPLNLKLGETKVPGSFRHVGQQSVAPPPPRCGRGQRSRNIVSHRAGAAHDPAVQGNGNRAKAKRTSAAKSLASRSKAVANVVPAGPRSVSTTAVATTSEKTGLATKKCPSPEYACSSPDVDDVQLNARHSCNRVYIKLRNKAMPPPGSADYESFVQKTQEENHRQRSQRWSSATARNWRECDARSDSDDDKPLPNPDTADISDDSQDDDENNGWKWSGEAYDAMVFSVDAGKHVRRKCYPAMKRRDDEGQETIVMVRDCVLLLASEDETPYVAKVTGLWEKPRTGAMTMSLLWYYRREHTEDTRVLGSDVSEQELFSSRHLDEISVACVEDRCHVLSYAEYCRVRARFLRDNAWGAFDLRRIVPPLLEKRPRKRPSVPREAGVDAGDVFFSRKHYDVKSKRLLKSMPPPSSLMHSEHSKRNSSVSA